MSRRRTLTGLLAGILMLAAAQPASAHTITKAQMRSAARDAARSIRTETGASSAAVLRCRRSSDHRARCRVETRYASGASRCITVVGIRLVGQKTRWRTGATTCY